MMRVLVGKSGVDLAGLEKSVGAPVAFLVRTWGRGMRGESKAGSSVLEERSNPAVAAIVNECKLRLSGGVPRRRLRGLSANGRAVQSFRGSLRGHERGSHRSGLRKLISDLCLESLLEIEAKR
ncbi:uncharacterized protein LOC112340795 [Selaginella moellendorffii]|uniref:uncharacterized protein LOC112340795 n=1 Tax=Selaginella moellendorffii TaxID=88036 RepID=UPI000D1CA745|nr:uncharacterized protein LOC112340795 [Selaginella moellendorffii]|eukprot:XP_024515582.1 uncharacterized protein LOC112340795 [Selaginella moellendorffii]